MSELELERIYTIPLRKVKAGSRNKMANRAVREVRSFLSRHMKSDDIWIDDAVNHALWARGMYTVPSKLRVRAVKFDDGVVEVSLPDEEATTSIRDTLREERESRTPVLAGVPEGAELPGMEAEETETGEIEAEPETGEIDAVPEEPEAPAEEPKEAAAEEKPAEAEEAEEEASEEESEDKKSEA